MKHLFTLLLSGLSLAAVAQTNPAPVVLNSGANASYTMSNWDSTLQAGTYPPNMVIHLANSLDPTIDSAMTKDYISAYNLTQKTRALGKGTDGIAFINTGTATTLNSGFLGALVLGFSANTPQTGKDWYLSYKCKTWTKNPRVYGIRLQGRPDTTQAWTDILDNNNNPMDYVTDSLSTNFTSFKVAIPASFRNQPNAQLRWKYYYVNTGTAGARSCLGIDDITLQQETVSSTTQLSNSIRIWPNPVSDRLMFDNSTVLDADFSIVDAQGRTILMGNVQGNNSIDVSSLPHGTYLLRFSSNNNGQIVHRFVK
jgi:hypothetical protein